VDALVRTASLGMLPSPWTESIAAIAARTGSNCLPAGTSRHPPIGWPRGLTRALSGTSPSLSTGS